MISNKVLFYTAKIILLSFFVCTNFVLAQDNALAEDIAESVDKETYQEVLNIVFPIDAKNNVFGYGFVLRFAPTFQAESQITIQNENGKISVTEYKATSSIYNQLNKILKISDEKDVEVMAKQIYIEKRTIKISSVRAKQWREEFYKSLSTSLNYERSIIGENMQQTIHADDGTRYSLWYGGAAEIFYEFVGGSSESPLNANESALINWMKRVKSTANKIK